MSPFPNQDSEGLRPRRLDAQCLNFSPSVSSPVEPQSNFIPNLVINPLSPCPTPCFFNSKPSLRGQLTRLVLRFDVTLDWVFPLPIGDAKRVDVKRSGMGTGDLRHDLYPWRKNLMSGAGCGYPSVARWPVEPTERINHDSGFGPKSPCSSELGLEHLSPKHAYQLHLRCEECGGKGFEESGPYERQEGDREMAGEKCYSGDAGSSRQRMCVLEIP
jgi:hypothetical protein